MEQQTSKDAITKKAVAGLKGLSEPWIGRDMIVPGTIDVRRLNVTQELAAQVVRAMSAETKNLVVTEDAILNRATIIEGLVTSKVAAKTCHEWPASDDGGGTARPEDQLVRHHRIQPLG